MSDMLYETLFVRLSVLQIMLAGGVLLGAYVFYKLVMKRVQKKPILAFALQISATVVISYLFFKIMQIHK